MDRADGAGDAYDLQGSVRGALGGGDEVRAGEAGEGPGRCEGEEGGIEGEGAEEGGSEEGAAGETNDFLG